ncbi:hypothetical protein TDSAC_1193 [Thermodesulfobium acidiphilum]|uniref:FAD-dependent protein C-terminal domain-containing protein n=2 Tax=Thermodesulfobium acidiphilum TaxID=1794699 RepID=A0A2R4W1E9_THEAF|nr:hypothetical protein TDSAC_1193 [Thermodesulfobium acidiphilum]
MPGYFSEKVGVDMKNYDIIIVGAGPAGIFAALELTKKLDDSSILIIEKGHDISKRHCPMRDRKTQCLNCTPCALMSGWGGAGAFSDGKLTLSTDIGGNLADIIGEEKLSSLVSYVDKIWVDFGGAQQVYSPNPEEEMELKKRSILADLKYIPFKVRHLGTDKSPIILQNMKEELEKKVDILTSSTVDEIIIKDNRVNGVKVSDGTVYKSKYVIVSPGRDGANWIFNEARRLGIEVQNNPVDIGVRVEVPATIMEQLTKITYEIKLIYYSKLFEDKVRTFCMNPYGEVVSEQSDGVITVNGHSYADRKTENTNFALLVSKSFTEPFKEPIAYGKYIARLANLLGGGVLVQRLGDLLEGRRSTKERLLKSVVVPTLKGATPGDISLVLPYRHLKSIIEMLQALDKLAPGVYSRYTLLYAVEVKYYSSRLKLDSNLMTPIEGLYGAGDGVGVTRGLIQASASGVLAANSIINKIKTN